MADKHPVIVTEFGYTKDDKQADGGYSLEYEAAVFEFAERNEISWVRLGLDIAVSFETLDLCA